MLNQFIILMATLSLLALVTANNNNNSLSPVWIFCRGDQNQSSIPMYWSETPVRYHFEIDLSTTLNYSVQKFIVQASQEHHNQTMMFLSTKLDNPELADLSIEGWSLRSVDVKFEDIQRNVTDPTFVLNGSIISVTKRLGRTSLTLSIHLKINSTYNNNSNSYAAHNSTVAIRACAQLMTIQNPARFIDKLFKVSVFCLVIVVSTLMGALIEVPLVIKQLKEPVALIVGFCCQYLIMPLLAFGLTKLFKYPLVEGMGLFIVGCSPGGTKSNQWTILFDGDIDLSAVMTFASISTSFVAMPLWLSTLGKQYIGDMKLRIPYWELTKSLLTVMVPYTVGIALSSLVPKTKVIVVKIVKPLVLLLMLFFITVGTYVNLHLFKTVEVSYILTAPLLPWLGFCLGSTVAYLCRLPLNQVKTVGIETGFQNVAIATLVVQNNLPSPERELATVVVLITAFLSSLPMCIAYMLVFTMKIYRKRREKRLFDAEMAQSSKDGKPCTKFHEVEELLNAGTRT